MIPVVKPAPPAILLEKGAAARQEHCDAYESAPKDYNSGAKTFAFHDTIYAARAVKDALRAAQHRKCAFCESIFDNTGYGDVEHFRPKAGYKQRETDELRRPGYYWLAYAWDNLFYSCQLCNQQFKRNLFPLADGRGRARTHRHDLKKEKPLLVDPCSQNSALFIGFREEFAYAVGGCREGEATIGVLGLNRKELLDGRRKHLKTLKVLVLARQLVREKIAADPGANLSDELRDLDELLQASREDAGEYAALARTFLDQVAPPGPRS
jgi:uncharacterized protein (TIGR02646 family)